VEIVEYILYSVCVDQRAEDSREQTNSIIKTVQRVEELSSLYCNTIGRLSEYAGDYLLAPRLEELRSATSARTIIRTWNHPHSPPNQLMTTLYQRRVKGRMRNPRIGHKRVSNTPLNHGDANHRMKMVKRGAMSPMKAKMRGMGRTVG
jgi:hypothetical protein